MIKIGRKKLFENSWIFFLKMRQFKKKITFRATVKIYIYRKGGAKLHKSLVLQICESKVSARIRTNFNQIRSFNKLPALIIAKTIIVVIFSEIWNKSDRVLNIVETTFFTMRILKFIQLSSRLIRHSRYIWFVFASTLQRNKVETLDLKPNTILKRS